VEGQSGGQTDGVEEMEEIEGEAAGADEAAESAEEGDAKTKSAVEAKEQYRKKYEDQYDADEKTSW